MNPETFARLHRLNEENDDHAVLLDALRPRFDRLAKRHENGTAPRAVSSFQLFQTPPELAARIAAALNLEDGARVLEPSAGCGRLLDALRPFNPSEVVAVEMSADCAGELYRQERAGVKIMQRDFLTVRPEELGKFDAVAMNPPFHMRADVRHILHALDFLRAGGRCAALCLNTSHRSSALLSLSDSWEELPAGTFGREGTDVETVLATFTKH